MSLFLARINCTHGRGGKSHNLLMPLPGRAESKKAISPASKLINNFSVKREIAVRGECVATK